MSRIYPVIMAGGTGTRLWPLSTQTNPKQYQKLFNGRSSFEETLRRCTPPAACALDIAPPVIVGSASHLDHIQDGCGAAGIAPHLVVLEPLGRNTAPVAAIVAELIAAQDPDGVILLMPADQHIGDVSAFWEAIGQAHGAAAEGYLTIFGITPTRPETGFGYVRTGAAINGKVSRVDAFVEKPDLDTAMSYLQSGTYFWNAGIFMFKAATLQEEAARHAPAILSAVRETLDASPRGDGIIRLDQEVFAQCPSRSIDYAIMEHTDRAAVIAPVSVGWNDIGSWQAISEVCRQDGATNATLGEVALVDSAGCYVRTDGPFIAAIGVENLVIVAAERGILVTRTDKSQRVKDVVTMLEDAGRTDLL